MRVACSRFLFMCRMLFLQPLVSLDFTCWILIILLFSSIVSYPYLYSHPAIRLWETFLPTIPMLMIPFPILSLVLLYDVSYG